jgi:hypothetical protein
MQWPRKDITVILETPGKHSPGVMALCSMWDSYGAIRSILETRGYRHHRIAPQTWQKAVLGNVEKGQTKPAALSRARQLWPDESFLATSKSTKPHEGLIDSALIAYYGTQPMKTILLDITIIALVIILSAALFFRLGKIIEGRQEDRRELTEREIQDLTEMRVMREWELQQQN